MRSKLQLALRAERNDLDTPPQSLVLQIPAGEVTLTGDLEIPDKARGLVLFVHGSGSSRRSPRNQAVAEILREANIATLLFDLLTTDEEEEPLERTAEWEMGEVEETFPSGL